VVEATVVGAEEGLADAEAVVAVVSVASDGALVDLSPDPSNPAPGIGGIAADFAAQEDEDEAVADRTKSAGAQAATPISPLPPLVA
jgi:cytochrome c551/c552